MLVKLGVENVIRLGDVEHSHSLLFVDHVLLIEQVLQLGLVVQVHIQNIHILGTMQMIEVFIDHQLDLSDSGLVH